MDVIFVGCCRHRHHHLHIFFLFSLLLIFMSISSFESFVVLLWDYTICVCVLFLVKHFYYYWKRMHEMWYNWKLLYTPMHLKLFSTFSKFLWHCSKLLLNVVNILFLHWIGKGVQKKNMYDKLKVFVCVFFLLLFLLCEILKTCKTELIYLLW